jgi:hypothetical protein
MAAETLGMTAVSGVNPSWIRISPTPTVTSVPRGPDVVSVARSRTTRLARGVVATDSMG